MNDEQSINVAMTIESDEIGFPFVLIKCRKECNTDEMTNAIQKGQDLANGFPLFLELDQDTAPIRWRIEPDGIGGISLNKDEEAR
jgi:hypothetical protein